jgi:hypothetical protein
MTAPPQAWKSERAPGARPPPDHGRVRETDWTAATAVALQVLHALKGVAPLHAFVAAGLTAHQVAALFRRAVLERPRIGWYVAPGIPWQGKLAVRVGGVATCVSAASAWGLPVPPDARPTVHVSVAQNAGRLRHSRDRTWHVAAGEDERAHVHWEDRRDPIEGWRTSLLDTLLHLGDCVPLEWFVAALDAALHRPRGGEPILSESEFVRLTDLLPTRLLPAIELVDPLAGSCLESLLRLGMRRRGIGPIVLQFSPQKDRFVDFLLPGKLIIEADGEEFHDPVKDAIRDASFRALGYRVLRFSYDRIVFDLEAVLDEIEAELAR